MIGAFREQVRGGIGCPHHLGVLLRGGERLVGEQTDPQADPLDRHLRRLAPQQRPPRLRLHRLQSQVAATTIFHHTMWRIVIVLYYSFLKSFLGLRQRG